VLEQRGRLQTGAPAHPCPLRPPSLLLIPRLLAERAVSHAFAGRAGRHARDPRSPRTPRTPSVAARAPLHHCPRGSWLVRRCWVVVAARALIGCPHVGAGWCTRGTMFAHVEPQNMYAHDSFKCCRYQVVVWGVCGAMGARESDYTRVVSDFVMPSGRPRRARAPSGRSQRPNPVTGPAEVVGSWIGRLSHHRMMSCDV
jgi:hypothetical protein